MVLPAEEGPEMPSKKMGGLFDAMGWPVVGDSVADVMMIVEFGFDAVWRTTVLSDRG